MFLAACDSSLSLVTPIELNDVERVVTLVAALCAAYPIAEIAVAIVFWLANFCCKRLPAFQSSCAASLILLSC